MTVNNVIVMIGLFSMSVDAGCS